MSSTALITQATGFAVPATQNTAPVIEFNCLYTHDIRRKTKRWQDGFLRFHTFNNRVMVYDVPRNFVGDTHWRDERPLQDGDEVTLDRGGVLVQVADQVGQTQTDLTDVKKTKKPQPERHALSSSPLRLPSGGVATAIKRVSQAPVKAVTQPVKLRAPLQDKHRSLNALLGSARAPIGKAVIESPFEVRARQKAADKAAEDRPAKRQKLDSARESSKADRTKQKRAREVDLPKDAELHVVDLSSDGPGDDLITQPTPKPLKRATKPSPVKSRPAIPIRTGTGAATDMPPPRTRPTGRPAAAKRKMLSCLPESNPVVGIEPTVPMSRSLQREQDKLNARLASIAEKEAARVKTRPAEASKASARSAEQHDRSISVIERASKGSDRPTRSKDIPAVDLCDDEPVVNAPAAVARPAHKHGEAYDLFGTAVLNRDENFDIEAQYQRRPGPEAKALDEDDRSSTCPNSPGFDVPSTFDMAAALERYPDMLTSRASAQKDVASSLALNEAVAPVRAPSKSVAVQQKQDPWSREAFDLFKWRPPGWDEERWCLAAS